MVDTKYTLMPDNPKVVPGKKFELSKNGQFDVYFDVGDQSSGQGCFFRDLQSLLMRKERAIFKSPIATNAS